eukprot:augustus_masked-scaffold_41-processed-gene-2.0-mRNA-1 protein AED:1.00 eAED:1.00 QI:0/0/0/0/1/1/2/0/225
MEDIPATQLTHTQEDLRTANDEIARLRASVRELSIPGTQETLSDLSRTEPQLPGSQRPGPRKNIEVKPENGGTENMPLTAPERFSTNELLLALVNELRSSTKGQKGNNSPLPRNSAPGFRPPKIKKLKSLWREEMSEFLMRIEKLRSRAQFSNIDICFMGWMSNNVTERLQAQGVDIHEDKAIITYLKHYKSILDESHNSQALSKLRVKLSWPKDVLTDREALER